MKRTVKRAAAVAALLLTTGLGALGASALIPHVLTGPRLIDGSVINKIIDCVNGVAQCYFSGTIAVPSAGGTPKVFHTGDVAPLSVSSTVSGATNTTPISTNTYIARVFIPVNMTLTGISVLNGSVSSGSIQVAIANHAGAILGQSASTSQTAAAYQKVPFIASATITGPAEYWLEEQIDNGTGRIQTHTIGNFGTLAVSSTYGTFPTSGITPTGFTAGVGPIADTY